MDQRTTNLVLVMILSVIVLSGTGQAELSSTFYDSSCPNLSTIVSSQVASSVAAEARMGASLMRLHFHDCWVNGCDGSVLLDDTATFTGEKASISNNNSLRGFDVIDVIKADLEAQCPDTVSCADILALVHLKEIHNLVVLLAVSSTKSWILKKDLGGPTWEVLFGRRDSLTASRDAANTFLPAPSSNVSTLRANFAAVGMGTDEDLVALSGAHTFGKGRCGLVSARIGGNPPDATIDPDYNATLNSICSAGAATLVDLDQDTPTDFDNAYYSNLLILRGYFTSDQVLQSTGGSTADLVSSYASDQLTFFTAFANSMIKMGNLSPLEGTDGEIRVNCRVVNSNVATM
ncbi:peroxidase [Marchantia polymorpha subsp. ruderalis]|uniref:Peroxidase n=2 Tax=Marchantia polymorpha TaxID=3197 RepID=A0AAF6C1F1_MARPO|nr:hypothetical protein MARPO_0067s0041 [Marchantia polymorpha]BBN18085.1 hypothetical protein Mp_7g19370 [Marchantia polymorpha subsp. ruderalis]|eukprot:PTQ35949.1 hypothetical protein MARPO_0067s0041 [Marchantia polymorpha]